MEQAGEPVSVELPEPGGDRTVAKSHDFGGMVQIERDGRCFQINGISRSARRKLERFAEAAIAGHPLPKFGRRWPDREEADAQSPSA